MYPKRVGYGIALRMYITVGGSITMVLQIPRSGHPSVKCQHLIYYKFELDFNQSGSCGTPPPEPSCRCERAPSRLGWDQTDNNRRVSTIRTHMVRNAADAIIPDTIALCSSQCGACASVQWRNTITPSPDSPLLRNASPGQQSS
jgi:hypothetical protein